VYLARLLDIPVSITVHAKDIYVADFSRLRRQLGFFDRVVTVCDYNVDFLSAHAVIDEGDARITVVACGVDVPGSLDEPDSSSGADVISVGRLVEKKGFDTLIRAISEVLPVLPGIRVRIIGEGPERPALERLIARLGLEEQVVMMGALSHEATLAEIAAAKVFCLAAQRADDDDSDALPVVVREAMARGLAVISTKTAGIPETVDDQVGWLVGARQPGDLARAISAALSDAERRRRRGLAGRERVRARWTTEHQVAGMLEVFGAPHKRALAAARGQLEDVAHSHSPV
jgi:glycosyltransferase involved in cell wall biosynthesis